MKYDLREDDGNDEMRDDEMIIEPNMAVVEVKILARTKKYGTEENDNSVADGNLHVQPRKCGWKHPL